MSVIKAGQNVSFSFSSNKFKKRKKDKERKKNKGYSNIIKDHKAVKSSTFVVLWITHRGWMFFPFICKKLGSLLDSRRGTSPEFQQDIHKYLVLQGRRNLLLGLRAAYRVGMRTTKQVEPCGFLYPQKWVWKAVTGSLHCCSKMKTSRIKKQQGHPVQHRRHIFHTVFLSVLSDLLLKVSCSGGCTSSLGSFY